MAKKGQSPLFARLFEQSSLKPKFDRDLTVGDAFDAAFDVLQVEGFRDEYVYRTAVVNKILMGKHSLRTASLLTEFRTGKCKADLVILNGTATVYEIKSERDTLARLHNQIENYKRVFATVNVIVSGKQLDAVSELLPRDVGIMRLSKRFQISIVRDALECPERICPIAVFETLRTVEAVQILEALGVSVPEVPNTMRHAALRDLFAELDPVVLHREFVRTLKQSRNLAPLSDLVDELPHSLHAAALSVPVRKNDHERLVGAVRTTLKDAVAWA